MNTETRHRNTRKLLVIVVIAILSLICNTACCSFSPIRELVGSYDSAVFYMCGKAMAHGYIPYEDFIDVKGPLLLLIFELGYNLSPGKSDALWLFFPAHPHTEETKEYFADSSLLEQAGYIYRCSVSDYYKGSLEVWALRKDNSLH